MIGAFFLRLGVGLIWAFIIVLCLEPVVWVAELCARYGLSILLAAGVGILAITFFGHLIVGMKDKTPA